MSLHQLTHAAGLDLHFDPAALAARLAQALAAPFRAWAAARREEEEMAHLDHRERADLNSRL